MITDDELRQYIAITTGKPETARLTQDEAAIFMQVHSAFAAELAAELLQRRESDRWVPVSERLPEDDVEVLVTNEEIDIQNVSWMDDKDWYIRVDSISGRQRIQSPTHWCPLPQPPEPK